MEETKTRIEISDRDYSYLLSMSPKFLYLGRDKRGMLWAFQRKPIKGVDEWILFWDYEMMKINSGLFMNVRWEDQDVHEVRLLKQYKEEERNVTNW